MQRNTSTKNHPAEAYAREVAGGRIVASKWVRLACKRHLRDLVEGHKRKLYFDAESAQDALNFFQFLRHSKGEWAGSEFKLSPWQQFIVWSIFGWKIKSSDPTLPDPRRFRSAFVEVARKNGKSTLCAGIGLYLFFGDGEQGAEVYCAATKKDQARIVFQEAERMRSSSPGLAKRIQKFRDNMSIPATASKFEPLGSDEDTLDGLNIHGAIVDELHAHKTGGVLEVLDTATSSRRQSLIFKITTAGFNRESICWKEHEYGARILDEINRDDSAFVYIACLDEKDDWTLEENWPKANPNLGISVKLDDLRNKANKAKQEPSALNAFQRLHLNVWTQQDTRWMPLDKWNECAGFKIDAMSPRELRDEMELRLEGETCYIGVDLSKRIDITAEVKVFPPSEKFPKQWIVIPRFWVPEGCLEKRVRQDRVPYDVWIREGYITATDGNVVDFDVVEEQVFQDFNRYKVQEVAFDDWNALQFSNNLKKKGVEMVEFGQGYQSMTEPTNKLMELVLEKQLAHLDNPVLRWMASNLVVKQDPAGNIKPNKDKSSEKIDGIVATVMALGRAISNPGESDEWDGSITMLGPEPPAPPA